MSTVTRLIIELHDAPGHETSFCEVTLDSISEVYKQKAEVDPPTTQYSLIMMMLIAAISKTIVNAGWPIDHVLQVTNDRIKEGVRIQEVIIKKQ